MTLKELIDKAKTLTISNQSAQEVSLQQATCVSVPPKLTGVTTANNLWDAQKLQPGQIIGNPVPPGTFYEVPNIGPVTLSNIYMSQRDAPKHWVNVRIDSLADLWVVKHGTGWADINKDVMERGSPEDEMLRELWFAGRLERMYRPDLGREVWRLIPKEK